MRIGKKGIDLIKSFEGCRLTAYLCPAKVWTIGYGHTGNVDGKSIGKGMKITQAKADDLLRGDLLNFEKAVKEYVKVTINQNQFDALVSFAFNCGAGALKNSTLLKKLNARDYKGASREFLKWNKGGGKVLAGLVRRRKAESELFLEGVVVVKPVVVDKNTTTKTPVITTITHIVVKGDTLGAIANRYKSTVDKIAKDNNIKNINIIGVGQKLKIIS